MPTRKQPSNPKKSTRRSLTKNFCKILESDRTTKPTKHLTTRRMFSWFFHAMLPSCVATFCRSELETNQRLSADIGNATLLVPMPWLQCSAGTINLLKEKPPYMFIFEASSMTFFKALQDWGFKQLWKQNILGWSFRNRCRNENPRICRFRSAVLTTPGLLAAKRLAASPWVIFVWNAASQHRCNHNQNRDH